MDRGAWWATVHGITKSWTWLSSSHTHTMCGKMQESELTKIIPLICISAAWGQFPMFLISWVSSRLTLRNGCSLMAAVQSLSRVPFPVIPWTTAHQASLSFINSRSLFILMSIEWWWQPTVSSCRPFLLLPSVFPSIRVFSIQSAVCIRWPKYWSFSFSISCFNEYSGLISFKIDCFDLLAVQGTLKSLLQHDHLKPSVRCSAFFRVQLSHPYMTTGKTIALTIWTFVSKVVVSAF